MTTHTISLSEAGHRLMDIIKQAHQGDSVIIDCNNAPSIQLVIVKKRIADLHQGKIHMSEDFDEPLDDNFWLGTDNQQYSP